MPAHLLHGDSFLVPAALRRLTAEAGAADSLEANRHQVQGSQAKPAELLAACNALPFMDSHRVVVVEGLLSTLEQRGGGRGAARGSGRGRGRSQGATSLGGWEELKRAIPEMPESTVLVFTDGALSENNPLLALLRPVCQVQSLKAPAGEALARWIKESARQKGAQISPAAVKLMAGLVGNDLWTLDRELEKLSLYASGRPIEESDVANLVAQVREASVFAAIDAMIDGRPGVALRLLRQLLQDGRDGHNIVPLIERQLRLLALARDSIDRGLPQAGLGERLGVNNQFVLQKTVEQARRHSLRDIKERYRRLLETDLAVKRGVMDLDLALELLVTAPAPTAGRR